MMVRLASFPVATRSQHMSYDVGFAAAGESALKERRIGALAAILALAALLGALALALLTSPEAGAPERAAAVASAAAATVMPTDRAVALARGTQFPPIDCSLVPVDSRDCIYY
jgi:hypothetical protein